MYLFKKPEIRAFYLFFRGEEEPLIPFFANHVADTDQALRLAQQYGFREEDLYLVEEATSAIQAQKARYY